MALHARLAPSAAVALHESHPHPAAASYYFLDGRPLFGFLVFAEVVPFAGTGADASPSVVKVWPEPSDRQQWATVHMIFLQVGKPHPSPWRKIASSE
ncbi:hypothetical protein FA15DRAFT_672045 [Coprinopsis marcescibilis]|uniref:Uncharacterized protein n=1 Tax=Coprinopsis marcescibilis TaxID=230819 RepID=A0A5C3KNC4_COPMA|nr:hypothetical protein FA15DRAFT_672045 [Coprinopsis marcescibilis]